MRPVLVLAGFAAVFAAHADLPSRQGCFVITDCDDASVQIPSRCAKLAPKSASLLVAQAHARGRAVSASGGTDAYAPLRVPSYRWFILGRACFLFGSQMQMAAVGWQLYEQTRSAMALGYVGLIQIIPVIGLALPAGQIADRFNRKRILILSMLLLLLCSIGLEATTVYSVGTWPIYALLFVMAVARIFALPAQGALLPSIVPREMWAKATAWSSTVFELTSMAGPAAAGGLIAATAGTRTVYLIAAGCALASAVVFSQIRIIQKADTRRASTVEDVVGGMRFVFKTRLLLSAASLDLFAVFLGGATTLLPIVAKDILHVGASGFGWLRAAPSIGAVTMAVLTAHLPPWKRSGRVLIVAFVGFGLSTVVFGLSRNFYLSMAMLALGGMCDNLNVVIRQTLVQMITPDQMRGRVTAINFIFIGCSNELGGFESGVTAQWFGTAPAIVIGGIGTILVVALVMRLAPQLRNLGRMDEVRPAPV